MLTNSLIMHGHQGSALWKCEIASYKALHEKSRNGRWHEIINVAWRSVSVALALGQAHLNTALRGRWQWLPHFIREL